MNDRSIEVALERIFRGGPVTPAPTRLRDAISADRLAAPGAVAPRRMRGLSSLAGLAAVIVVSVGLAGFAVSRTADQSVDATPDTSRTRASQSITTADGIRIRIETSQTVYRQDEFMPIHASMVYDGPGNQVTAEGDVPGFGADRLDGNGSFVNPRPAVLMPYVFKQGVVRQDQFGVEVADFQFLPGLWEIYYSGELNQVPFRVSVIVRIVGPRADGTRASESVTTSDNIRYSISTPKATYRENEPIDIEASAEYLGPDTSIPVEGGRAGFGVREVGGTRQVGPAYRADCMIGGRMARGDVVKIAFGKSGAFDRDNPADDFAEWYLNRPELNLPAGLWEIYMEGNWSKGDGCVGTRTTVSVIVRVLP